MKTLTLSALCVIASLSAAAHADTRPEADQQRNVNQQERIEQGLQSGELNTKEAGKLEAEQSHVDRIESRAMSNGTVSTTEQARITNAQNAVSKDIYAQKHDAQTGNPASASSQRMQADVQRNVNQQTRIQNGIDNGSLNTREVGRLEHGQSRVNRAEAHTAANGHVSKSEEARVQSRENHQSAHVWKAKHNGK
jgi:hypothetical protein